MPNLPALQQEPSRVADALPTIWFGMRCDFTRAALEGAMATGEAGPPQAIVLPAAPTPATSGWPEPPFDRWIRSLGIAIIGLPGGRPPDWQPVLDGVAVNQPSVGVVACFPYKVPRVIREAFREGMINIHPSLLPHLRGPEPVFHAYRLGLDTTGVTLHLLDGGWDTGPVLRREPVPIPDRDDIITLEASLARRGGGLLPEIIEQWRAGAIVPQPQDEAEESWAPVPVASDLVIPAELTIRKAIRMMRALGDTFGPLAVRDATTDALVSVASLVIDPIDEGAGQGGHDHVEVRLADGVARFDRQRARKG